MTTPSPTDPGPRTHPARPLSDARLRALARRLERDNALDRAALDQARQNLRAVRACVDELFTQRGHRLHRREDTDQVFELLRDTLETAQALLPDAVLAGDGDWYWLLGTMAGLQLQVSSLDHYRDDLLADEG